MMSPPFSAGRAAKAVAMLAVIAVGGYFVGVAFSSYSGAQIATPHDSHSQHQPDAVARIISVGAPLPEIVVWSLDGVTAVLVHELLPQGGIVITISGDCKSCKRTVASLQQARAGLGADAPEIVVVVADDPTEILGFMNEQGIRIPIYRDTEETFRNVYRLIRYPTVIRIGADGIVNELREGIDAEKEFAALLAG
jgi:hypothetical protein